MGDKRYFKTLILSLLEGGTSLFPPKHVNRNRGNYNECWDDKIKTVDDCREEFAQIISCQAHGGYPYGSPSNIKNEEFSGVNPD